MDAKDPLNPGAPASIGGITMGHAAIGIGTGTTVMWLTTLLTGWHGWTAAQAGAAAGLLTTGGAAIYLLVAWFIGWKWPTAPALPGWQTNSPISAPGFTTIRQSTTETK
jgi:hypothetical protein